MLSRWNQPLATLWQRLAFGALFASFSLSGGAQSPTSGFTPADSQADNIQHQSVLAGALETVLSVAVIKAGYGFASVPLGSTLQEVETRWGKPHKTQKTGTTPPTTVWTYQLDSHTQIEFFATTAVKEIRVHGSAASILRTDRGLRLGQRRNNILEHYGQPNQQSTTELRYLALGIRFMLNHSGQLERVIVFPPRQ